MARFCGVIESLAAWFGTCTVLPYTRRLSTSFIGQKSTFAIQTFSIIAISPLSELLE
jgi:hypothetical protein